MRAGAGYARITDPVTVTSGGGVVAAATFAAAPRG
jgi:hypothetical protein